MWKQVPSNRAGQIFHLKGQAIPDTFEIKVVEPFQGAASSGQSFPTMYVLDSSLTFDIVAGTKHLYDIFSVGAVSF